MTIVKKFFIKSTTNTGDLCKQYFYLGKYDGAEGYTLMIHKYMLTKSNNLKYYKDLKYLKVFKGRFLFQEEYAIRLNTLVLALDEVKEFI